MPVAFELLKKTEWAFDEKKKEKWPRKSPTTNNEHYYRKMLWACVKNRISASTTRLKRRLVRLIGEHMRHVKEESKKEFIMPIKSNRKVAFSSEDNKDANYEQVGSAQLEPNTTKRLYLEQVPFGLLLCKQVFTNEDGSEGVVYLLSSDLTLDHERLTTIYQREGGK